MSDLEIEGLTKRYGQVVALDEFSLRISKGELVSLLGPSGCGKTTALRIIAGFIRPTAGVVRIDGRVANSIPPHHRDIGMVFQNYALFPHMTVTQNVEFGLKMRKVPEKERNLRVAKVLEIVRLAGFEKRYPSQLSGGQQQRVAVARAIVINPTVLLLDEPLSNLDAKLRVETREEIRRLQQDIGVTTIFVTHDQEEALTISDRVAVMHAGQIEQVGTPVELYNQPRTSFVATFIGTSNMWSGRVRQVDRGHAVVALSETEIQVLVDLGSNGFRPAINSDVTLLIRPERVVIDRGPEMVAGPNSFTGRVTSVMFVGAVTRYSIQVDKGLVIRADIANAGGDRWNTGEAIRVSWSPSNVVLIPSPGGDGQA